MDDFILPDIKNELLLPGGMCIPTLDHRDRDFLKSFKFAGAAAPKFPDEYDTDAGLWMPNQNEINPEFPNTGPQPYGCTNFVSGDISADLDGILKDPAIIEAITGANAAGGYDIRKSLLVAKKLGWITGFYNVQAYAPLDYFDAICLASFSGLPEKRSVSMGTPWYSDWQAAATGSIKRPDGTYDMAVGQTPRPFMPMPSSLDYTGIGWHNWKVGGWKTVNGTPWLKAKPLEGNKVGDGGWIYFDRATINAVMGLKYTIAFTATHMTPHSIYKIDMALFDKFYSFLQTQLGLRY